jgi:hypothetical protein
VPHPCGFGFRKGGSFLFLFLLSLLLRNSIFRWAAPGVFLLAIPIVATAKAGHPKVAFRLLKWPPAITDRKSDLKNWVDVLKQMMNTKKIVKLLAFANNHYAGHSPATAKLFTQLWDQKTIEGRFRAKFTGPVTGPSHTALIMRVAGLQPI